MGYVTILLKPGQEWSKLGLKSSSVAMVILGQALILATRGSRIHTEVTEVLLGHNELRKGQHSGGNYMTIT